MSHVFAGTGTDLHYEAKHMCVFDYQLTYDIFVGVAHVRHLSALAYIFVFILNSFVLSWCFNMTLCRKKIGNGYHSIAMSRGEHVATTRLICDNGLRYIRL